MSDWVYFPTVRITLKITKTKLQNKWNIFSHWKAFLFLSGFRLLWWCLVHLETIEPQPRQFSKRDIWRLQKDTWKPNYIMSLMRCKILFYLLNYFGPHSFILSSIYLPELPVFRCIDLSPLVLTSHLWHCLWSGLPLLILFAGNMIVAICLPPGVKMRETALGVHDTFIRFLHGTEHTSFLMPMSFCSGVRLSSVPAAPF